MRAQELDLRELLDLDPQGGVIHFGGQRALLLDAVAMGILRRELVQIVGLSEARGILTRFGYAHGWRTAESLKTAFPWDSDEEWKGAGGRLHTLQGLVVVGPAQAKEGPGPRPLGNSIWHESYEAEQHLLHLGQAEHPVCWTLTGFASGYLSYCHGREVYCIEERCRGQGDATCRLVGRLREDWGAEIEPHLAYYQRGCLDNALQRVTAELKKAERKLRARRQALGESEVDRDASGLIAKSAAMERVLAMARHVAKSETTVLITGESGVGKEQVARLIHDRSARTGGPFVAVNCGAIAEGLLDSEFFGHAKGAFTGATSDRPGLFEAANGGTLFLDEIGELPPTMQVKLLRVLQEREVRRVGENDARPIDVRLVAATNRDLLAEVHAARFRQDLYYRIRVVEIPVPSLRERADDILPLAREFLSRASARLGRKLTGFLPQAAHQLLRYSWPGNVRELQNAIERAVVLSQSERIDASDLPSEVALASAARFTPGDARTLADVERDYILQVLEANDGNRARTAEQLGIGAATLYRKLKQFGARATPSAPPA